MGSSRLPGKVLAQVAGKPLLGYLIDRLRASKTIDDIIIATTADPLDQCIVKFCKESDVAYFQGDAEDVLSRYNAICLDMPKLLPNSSVVRITGDCPLVDPQIVDRAVRELYSGSFDYCSNTLAPTFADGFDVEVFTTSLLSEAAESAKKPSEREHVTLWMKQAAHVKKHNLTSLKDSSHLRLTVDEQEDLDVITAVIQNCLSQDILMGYQEICDYLQSHPELQHLNSHITRDEGLRISLLKDKEIST